MRLSLIWLWRVSLAISLGITIPMDAFPMRLLQSVIAKSALTLDSVVAPCAYVQELGPDEDPEREYAQLLEQFRMHNDAHALITGERLLRNCPDQRQAFPQAEAIVADLRRRQKRGTLGIRARSDIAAGFGKWSAQKKIAYLIDSLDEVEYRDDQGLFEDRRVASLIAIGAAAIPALIDAVETDKRLTRSVYFKGGTVSASGRVMSVRECALNAALKALDIDMSFIRREGEHFTEDSDVAAKALAARLRAYWRKSREVPFVDLMMMIINDPQATGDATREAAAKLAHYVKAIRGNRALSDPSKSALRKLETSAPAQAILGALDRDLKRYDLGQPTNAWERRLIENGYLESISDIGDRSIAREFVRRYEAARTTHERRLCAYAAYTLGERGPMADFARRVEAGTLTLPANDNPSVDADGQPGNLELRDIIDDLIRARTAEADRALFAIATPRHPYCAVATSRLLELQPQAALENRVWFCHPYCLCILRREMDNEAQSDETIRIQGQKLIHETKTSMSLAALPASLRNPGLTRVVARRCDQAAERVADLIFGLPPYVALQNDAPQKLAAIKWLVDRFAGRYRRLTPPELKSLAFSQDEVLFMPDIRPLTRPATQADVTAHDAIFHLDGKRSLANLQLPAVGVPKKDEAAVDDFGRPRRFIILQAEIDSGGNTVYGVIGAGNARMVRADEFNEIKPIPRSALP
jgi:hypothetical protein